MWRVGELFGRARGRIEVERRRKSVRRGRPRSYSRPGWRGVSRTALCRVRCGSVWESGRVGVWDGVWSVGEAGVASNIPIPVPIPMFQDTDTERTRLCGVGRMEAWKRGIGDGRWAIGDVGSEGGRKEREEGSSGSSRRSGRSGAGAEGGSVEVMEFSF